jgi:hypothetical protein
MKNLIKIGEFAVWTKKPLFEILIKIFDWKSTHIQHRYANESECVVSEWEIERVRWSIKWVIKDRQMILYIHFFKGHVHYGVNIFSFNDKYTLHRMNEWIN